MSTIKHLLEAVLASWRGFWYKVVHLITYAVNPLYRATYALIQAEEAKEAHKQDMLFSEIGNDMYYSSYQYKTDSQLLINLDKRIKNLKEKVIEIKNKGY